MQTTLADDDASVETLFDDLMAPGGPARHAWVTRVHWRLRQQCRGEFVFRFGQTLNDLADWLEATTGKSPGDGLLPYLSYDEDQSGPRLHRDAGAFHFEWNGWRFRLFSALGPTWRCNRTYAWIAAPDRAAAEALVLAVAMHGRGKRPPAMVFEDGDWEACPRLEAMLSGYSWESVVLPQPAGERLRAAAELFFRSRPVYEGLGIPWKLGFLLVGPPGTGKTLTTKVLAATLGVPFLFVRGLNSFGGSAPDAGTVRAMFQGARSRTPCLLCLEDLDTLVTDAVRSAFLNEMDGFEEDYRGVLTVATTNHPERLDTALLHRPSRFDYRFELPLPGEAQRREFVDRWVRKLAALGYVDAPEAGIEVIVSRGRGMSLAYLKRVLTEIALRMNHHELRGDAAFERLASEEVADARQDRAVGQRAESGATAEEYSPIGFRADGTAGTGNGRR